MRVKSLVDICNHWLLRILKIAFELQLSEFFFSFFQKHYIKTKIKKSGGRKSGRTINSDDPTGSRKSVKDNEFQAKNSGFGSYM